MTISTSAAARRGTCGEGSYPSVDNTRFRGEYAVKLNLSEPIEPGVKLPSDIDGVPLRVEVTGTIRRR